MLERAFMQTHLEHMELIIVDDDDHGNGNGKLIGSNFIANWGSVGFFGPLTIHPDYWGKGITRF